MVRLHKISTSLIYLPILRSAMPVAICASVLAAGIYLQASTPRPAQIQSQSAAAKQAARRHQLATPKTTPAAAAPKATASAPKTTPARVAVTPHTVRSAKPEPVISPSPSSSVSGLTPVAPNPSSSSGQSAPSTATSYTSTNWSGWLAANSTFTGVTGSWTATSASGVNGVTSADATWIGIGGVTTDDLIQVGTQNIISGGGHVSSSAFYEMLPDASLTVPGVTVTPGDNLTASIVQVSTGEWDIRITDITDGQSYNTTVAYNSSESSAEWIEEDPSFSFRRQIPFDNFGTASFAGSGTVMNGSSLSIATANGQPITMVNGSGQIVAAPSALGSDGGSFSVSRENF